MGDCPECNYYVKHSIYNTWHPQTDRPIAVFQCPNSHVWFEEIKNIGGALPFGKVYDTEALRTFNKELGLLIR